MAYRIPEPIVFTGEQEIQRGK